MHGEFFQVNVWDGAILKFLAGRDKLMLTQIRNKQREEMIIFLYLWTPKNCKEFIVHDSLLQTLNSECSKLLLNHNSRKWSPQMKTYACWRLIFYHIYPCSNSHWHSMLVKMLSILKPLLSLSHFLWWMHGTNQRKTYVDI